MRKTLTVGWFTIILMMFFGTITLSHKQINGWSNETWLYWLVILWNKTVAKKGKRPCVHLRCQCNISGEGPRNGVPIWKRVLLHAKRPRLPSRPFFASEPTCNMQHGHPKRYSIPMVRCARQLPLSDRFLFLLDATDQLFLLFDTLLFPLQTTLLFFGLPAFLSIFIQVSWDDSSSDIAMSEYEFIPEEEQVVQPAPKDRPRPSRAPTVRKAHKKTPRPLTVFSKH